jgi:hypothetical protein
LPYCFLFCLYPLPTVGRPTSISQQAPLCGSRPHDCLSRPVNTPAIKPQFLHPHLQHLEFRNRSHWKPTEVSVRRSANHKPWVSCKGNHCPRSDHHTLITPIYRALGTPLAWPEAKKVAGQVREWGIEVRVPAQSDAQKHKS